MENFAPTSIPCFRALDETTPTVKTKRNKTKTSLCHLCKPDPHDDSDTLYNDLFYTWLHVTALQKHFLKILKFFLTFSEVGILFHLK